MVTNDRRRMAGSLGRRVRGEVVHCMSLAIPAIAILSPSGCSKQTAAPSQTAATPSQAVITTEASPHKPYSVAEWGLVLRRALIGFDIDYGAIAANRLSLDNFLSVHARRGPQTTPDDFATPQARLAYWINAYNAATLWSVAALIQDGKLPAQLPRGLESRRQFNIDGRLLTPADLRAEALREAGDNWRVRFALCDGTRSTPPLMDRPILPDLLDAQLDAIVARALASPQIIMIDHGEHTLRVWADFHHIQGRLLAAHRAAVRSPEAGLVSFLLTRCEPDQRLILNTAVGYRVRPLPASRAVNSIPAEMDNESPSPFAGLQLPSFNWQSPK